MSSIFNFKRSDELKEYADSGGNLHVRKSSGSTLMHRAAKKGDVKAIRVLSNEGVDINAKNKNENTPTHYAAMHGRRDSLKILIKKGADINAINKDGDTPRSIAEKYGKVECIKIIDSISEEDYKSNSDDDDDDDEGYDKYLINNNIMNESYKSSTYKTRDNKEIIANSTDINLKSNEEAKFDDGTEFIMVGYIGKGQQTCAYLITILTLPKVLKELQNDESMKNRVVTPAEFTINICYPFNGESREDDYNNYLIKYNLSDNDDEESLREYFDHINETFNSFDVKEYNEKRYSVSKFFDVIKESANEKRDCIRLCYYYYLLNEMKIAHCDVAPRNVLITYDGPVLIDFGASVKFGAYNLNPLPYDVTPKHYIDKRGVIHRNHDVKGFYYTATQYFPNIVPYDEDVMKGLDEERQTLGVEDYILQYCQ